MKHYGDITKISGYHVPPVNVVIGGSPCQDLSVAGKRVGLAGERSGLFMEQIRLIKEMRLADEQRGNSGGGVRPRFMVWENVPGAFSSNRGADFGAVLQETIRVIEPEAPDVLVPDGGWPMAGCLFGADGGWSIAWRVLDAQFWGAPQRRRRISLVADFGGERAPEVLFEREGMSWDYPARRTPREGTAADVARSADGAEQSGIRCLNPWDSQTIRQYAVDGVSPCLSSNATGGQNRAGICAPVAYAQQSFGDCKPSDVAGTQCGRRAKDATDLVCYPETARSLLARHDGSPCLDRGPNVVFQSAPIAFSNRGQTGGETAETLRAESHGALPMVCAAGFKGGQSEKARSIGFVDEQAPTLSANGSHLDPTVFCIQGNCIDRADTAGCNGKGWKAEQSYTLNTVDRPAVVYDARGNGKGEIAPTQTGDHQSRVTDYTALVVSDVAAVDCRNGTENTGVNGTLQAKSNGGQSLNLHLPDALECVKAWGFQYVTLITWCKDSMGLGQYFRGMTEHCIFATTQKKLPYKLEEGKRMQGVTGFVEPKREHSRKPETMRKMIERVSYTPRIELFARRAAPGWKVWGNEAPEEQEAAT